MVLNKRWHSPEENYIVIKIQLRVGKDVHNIIDMCNNQNRKLYRQYHCNFVKIQGVGWGEGRL